MDFREDLEFHDDSGRMTDKAKESILLMKKKMLRSHDLILQYNNKMKECDRLKGDLSISQEKAMKFQKEAASNNTKILKFESQISNHKKSREELEQRIAEQEIKMAGDKCHTEQLICKLKELETAHSGMLIEADMTKSSLEEKIKQLEQEMKKLKKAQAHDLEKSLKPQRGKTRMCVETAEIGVNTTEERQDPVKPTTAEKSIMTDEFYHIRDNPYPIFCENCQILTKPDIDKFFKTMTYHPPLLDEIASPPPLMPPPPPPQNQEFWNRDDPLGPLEPKKTQELIAESLSIVSPEIESLKEKLATLERKMKKKSKKVCRKPQQPSASCCGHSHQANCCPTSNRGPVMSPIFPDVQSDLFAEFWNRVMSSANERTSATNNARSKRVGQKNKSFVLNKRKMKVSAKRKPKKCVGSSNWEVESDDSENQVGHLLRVKKKKKSGGDFIEESSIEETEETSIDKEPINTKTSPRRSSSRIRARGLCSPEIKRKTVNSRLIENRSPVSIDGILVADASPESDFVSGPSPTNLADVDLDDSDLNVSMNSTEETIRESRPEFDEETSQQSTRSPQTLHEKTRKRKRSNSLSSSKRSVKSKLLCKLRALKKNTTPGAKFSSPIDKNHDSNKNDSSQDSPTTEPLIEIAPKKNRIAHVPKTCMSKECDQVPKEMEILEKKTAINVPREETRGVHFSLNHLQAISQAMEKPKNRVTKMKSPTIRNVSNLKKSLETDQTNAIDNIVESSVLGENETTPIDRSEASLNEEKKDFAASKCIDESPASPSDTHKSNSPNACLDSTGSPKSFYHASIYETAVLPDEPPPATDEKSDTILRDSPICHDSQTPLDNSDDMSGEKEKPIVEKSQAIVKDLRTRSIVCSPVRQPLGGVDQQNLQKSTDPTIQDNGPDKIGPNYRGIRTLETLLTRHLGSQKKKYRTKARMLRKSAAVKLQMDAEQSIKSELDNLLGSEEWSSSLHTSVVTKFCQVAGQRRTLAKCIVDVLVERAQLDETLDRTYTPPAPVMTGTQQRIAALINDLERDPSMSGVFELVRAGIDFNLFRLGHSIQPPVVEYLARMLIVMARLKKDRESARIMCCDALYFLGRMAPNVIYIALTIWPEILPMHDARPDVMTSSLIHLIRQQQGTKVVSIRRMFKDYYKFPENDQQSTELIKLLMSQLDKEYSRELEVAILLIAKREGTEWAYKHIVDGGLMQIIENDNCPWIANILTLLGFILRTFPTEDEDKKVGAMVEKLCNMLESSQDDRPDKEEGIIAALLGLARHTQYFKRIADTILKWKPSDSMRAGTIEQLEAFFKLRSPEWWNKWKNNRLK